MGDTNIASPRQSIASQNSTATTTTTSPTNNPIAAIKFAHQAEKLSHLPQDSDGTHAGSAAVVAEWITPQDPIIITADGGRLPGVPLAEAHKLNKLREGIELDTEVAIEDEVDENKIDPFDGIRMKDTNANPSTQVLDSDEKKLPKDSIQKSGEGSLRRAMPPYRTNPLFPPLPLYGPPSRWRDIQCITFQVSSFFLSLAFLAVIVLGSAFTSIPLMFKHIWLRMRGTHPDEKRPFIKEERRREKMRQEAENSWKKRQSRRSSQTKIEDSEDDAGENGGFVPTEGGPDPIICDAGYYARRVGLDIEEFKVQTEDGFIIRLWHVYNPLEFTPMTPEEREARGPDIFTDAGPSRPSQEEKGSLKPKFPILLMHGLLQSSGAYCTNDDASLAFYLCKAGYDVWLGNNRCGFYPEHTLLSYNDPRMWAWNIRQMGVMDLPALISRVLSETSFPKLGLICHSQGTTQTFVALAKEQRPDIGDKITVFCALAPAVYAGPLIGKMYFKFMRVITPGLFRLVFGIHAFIPFMMTMHATLPGTLYGAMGYRVFSFLFNWTDDRWERGLRDRLFQFAPVYVSAESMRWWLGRECFAKQKCILATKEEGRQEDKEDEMDEYYHRVKKENEHGDGTAGHDHEIRRHPKGSTAWYDSRCPPLALWVAGSDDLVDGRRLLRRFERGREPHVKIVHSKIIEEYEHLDVIWAIDSIEKVGSEVKEVLWKTCNVRDTVRVPIGCEDIEAWSPEDKTTGGADGGTAQEDDDGQSSNSDSEELVAPILESRASR
jgi:pimeloyl-ACP methyl ester carboxylesterase